MADMLKVFVKQELDDQIKTNYSHLKYPPCIYAEIVKVEINNSRYVCTIRILDKTKKRDENFPEVPNVITDIPFEKGNIAVCCLLYGDCNPYILGRLYE